MDFIFTQAIPQPGTWELLEGDALETLRALPDKSVRCIVTSPPYFRKFSYGVEGECGVEASVQDYVDYQTRIALELRRITCDDANFFYVVQDSFNATGGSGGDFRNKQGQYHTQCIYQGPREKDLPAKSQCLVPERIRLAFAGVGWVPTLKIVWDKKDSRRAAVDRPSYSYEEILVFAANPKHYWDREAVVSKWIGQWSHHADPSVHDRGLYDNPKAANARKADRALRRPGAYLRSVWDINAGAQPKVQVNGEVVKGIACFPLKLAEILVNLGSAPGDVVLDPFAGMGTTLLAATKWGRNSIGIELSPKFAAAARVRLREAGY